ncbi:MAG TPA: L,D-transpeptidase [Thermomicrobiales bacterium]
MTSISRPIGLAWSLRLALGLALLLALAAPWQPEAAAQQQAVIVNDLSTVELPPDIGQSEYQVYVPETRHTLRGSMLDYWRANGAAAVYGYPISEPFAAENGYYSQAFEAAVFQYHPEYLYTDEPIMRLMPIGEPALEARRGDMRRDGRRGFGGGDRRHAAWTPLPSDSRAAARAIAEGGFYSELTGHTVSGAFYDWYAEHEGWYYLGDPLSQPVAERGVVVQYFSGALLMRHADGRVRLAPLAREMADELGIPTEPVPRNGLPTFRESFFLKARNPNPLGDPTEATGRKWIEVSISRQMLWAYQGDTLIMSSPVSTGLPPNETELGVFHVRLKYPEQDMRGFESETGEVIAFEDAPPGSVLGYDVEDVPHVMYFNMDAESLHGTYWHNNFGQRMSHGCVNLPLDVAAFLYDWAPLGTMVWVHE